MGSFKLHINCTQAMCSLQYRLHMDIVVYRIHYVQNTIWIDGQFSFFGAVHQRSHSCLMPHSRAAKAAAQFKFIE